MTKIVLPLQMSFRENDKDSLISSLQQEVVLLAKTLDDHRRAAKDRENKQLVAMNTLIKERQNTKQLLEKNEELLGKLSKHHENAMEAKQKELDDVIIENNKLGSQLDSLREEYETMKSQLNEAMNENKVMKSRVSDLSVQLEDSRSVAVKMEKTFEKLEKAWKLEKKELLQEMLMDRTSESLKIIPKVDSLREGKENAVQTQTESSNLYEKKYKELKKRYLKTMKILK